MIKEIAHIIANHIDYETHGKWTLPVMTGDKVDMVASERRKSRFNLKY